MSINRTFNARRTVYASLIVITLTLAGCGLGETTAPEPTAPPTAESEAALEASPTALPDVDIDALLEEADAYLDAWQIDEAQALYLEILESEPNNALALYGLGVVNQRSFLFDEARISFEAALAADPTLVRAYTRLAELNETEGDFVGYADTVMAALEVAPDDPDAHLLATPYYQKIGDFQQALDHAMTAIELAPGKAVVYANRGDVYLSMGEDDLALADYERAMELDPDLGVVYLGRARLRMRNLDLQGALDDARWATKVESDNPTLYCQQGEVFASLSHFGEAITAYTNALDIAPRAADCAYNRGTIFNRIGQYQYSVEDFELAIDIWPDFLEAYNNLGTAYLHLEEWEKANEQFTHIIDTDPFPQAYANRGYVLYQMGQYEPALDDLNNAIAFYPSFLTYFDRALTQWALGYVDRGVSDLHNSILLNSDQVYNTLDERTHTTDSDHQLLSVEEVDPLVWLAEGVYWDYFESSKAKTGYQNFLSTYDADDDLRAYALERLEFVETLPEDPAATSSNTASAEEIAEYYDRAMSFFQAGDMESGMEEIQQGVQANQEAFDRLMNERALKTGADPLTLFIAGYAYEIMPELSPASTANRTAATMLYGYFIEFYEEQDVFYEYALGQVGGN